MARGGDEVQKSVHPVVPEAGITLDTRLLRENVIILTLEVAYNLLEAARCKYLSCLLVARVPRKSYANSLSMLSPKPGVSTIVRAIRTPSSSSSGDGDVNANYGRRTTTRTDVNRLDPDALLNMCSFRAVRDFVGKHLRLTKGVHKRRAASTRGTCIVNTTDRVTRRDVNNERWQRNRRQFGEITNQPP